LKKVVALAEGESKVRFDKDLATYHSFTDAACLSKAGYKEAVEDTKVKSP
jgi:hypothetical protein